ncbi:Malate dehydrogenase, cytoplasmic [Echinococcus granulosus]|uniref:Malate dehydrogenase, cytoplasmic n=1 Tax=Echinococcus granulosus TaxID=6210 RepID=W6U9W5_ECHGR|nr:Malate dehydrogenase, cytoplasmic [Echinococcus granulosus]EUB57810.1 Malate dehydrogenase, cytoplasmic [Echinococcus granulosus]
MFGQNQPVTITLYDLFAQDSQLQVLVDEAQDSGLEPLEDIHTTTDPDLAFKDIDVAIMLDTIEAASYAHKNERLKQCWQVYRRHGEYLDKYGKQTTKIIVTGDPVNTNAYILSKYTPSLPKSCITGLVRMDQNRATFQVANKLNAPVEAVKNVLIWGNAGSGAFIDITHSKVQMENGAFKPATELINNEHWMKHVLQPYVQNWSSECTPADSIAILKAKAIIDHVNDLWFGTNEDWTSMVVYSNGEYGTPVNFFSGYPVIIPQPKGNPIIVADLTFEDWGESQFERTAHEMADFEKRILQLCECADEITDDL